MEGRTSWMAGKAREIVVGTLLLSCYALALFGSPDPEWTVWAGQMAVGVLYVPPPEHTRVMEVREAMSAAAVMGAAGLAAGAALGVAGLTRNAREAWARLKNWLAPAEPGAGPHF